MRIQDAIEAAQRTDTVIHIILVYDPQYGANMGAAKKLTEETGGRVIVANSGKKLEQAFDEISEELRSQYTLGYYPSNPAKDGKFHKLKIDLVDDQGNPLRIVNQKGKNVKYKIVSRDGYYAPKS
jgi:VWFA-related protein